MVDVLFEPVFTVETSSRYRLIYTEKESVDEMLTLSVCVGRS